MYGRQLTLSKIDSSAISNPKADVHSINAFTKFENILWYLLKL